MRVDKEKKIQDLIEEHERKEARLQEENQGRLAELKDTNNGETKKLQDSLAQKEAQIKELKLTLSSV
jgi:hypothetical protein